MKQPSKAASIISWIAVDILWYGCAIEGMMNNEHHFLSIFKFITWLVVVGWILTILGKLAAAVIGQDYPPFKRHISAYAAFMSDFGLAVISVAYGHWFYAILIMFQDSLEQMYFYKKPETKERKQNAD